jgi:hypothetical protein
MPWPAGAHICRCLRRPGIDSEELIHKFQHCAGIFKQSLGTRNRVGIGLLYRPARAHICKPFKEHGIHSQPGGPERQPYLLYRLARLHRLLNRLQIRAKATLASGIGSLESIPWFHNMKNEDEDDFFGSKRRKMNIFVPQLMKEQRKTNYLFLYYQRNEDKPKYLFREAKYLFLNYPRNEDEVKYLLLNYRRNEDEAK